MSWVSASLAKTSPRIKVFDVDKAERAEDDDGDTAAQAASGDLVVDWNIGR
jgi:hypothetical protein